MVKFILIKSPDEWATTKQACRDELVVYLFFSPIYIYTPVYKNVAISEIYTIYMYECQKKTKARWIHITATPWCGHYLQYFFSICISVFSGDDKKDTGAEKV